MILMIQCGNMTAEQQKAVQAKMDTMPAIKDWCRYFDTSWFVETDSDLPQVRDELKKVLDDTSIFITPLHYYNGFMNKTIWDWLKGREMAPSPKPRAPERNKEQDERDPATGLNSLIEITDAPDLTDFIGMEDAVAQLRQQIAGIGFRAAARRAGLRVDSGFANMLLSGPPGVGKTTLAKSAAVLLKNNLPGNRKRPVYLVQAADLIGRYTGKSASNTKNVLRAAEHGILIFDEIDSLMDVSHYGEEVLNTLNTHMGLSPNKPIIIGTLYDKREKAFRDFNAGLSSRFPHVQRLQSYDDKTLVTIFKARAEQAGLQFSPDAQEALTKLVAQQRRALGVNFGNAREIDNMYHATIDILAARYAGLPDDVRAAFDSDDDTPERTEAIRQISTIGAHDIPVRDSRTGALTRSKESQAAEKPAPAASSSPIVRFPDRRPPPETPDPQP